MSTLAEDAQVIVRRLLTGSIVNADGTPVDCSAPYIETIEGEEAKPYLWIISAWCSAADHAESPDEPNLKLTGAPEGFVEPDDADDDVGGSVS